MRVFPRVQEDTLNYIIKFKNMLNMKILLTHELSQFNAYITQLIVENWFLDVKVYFVIDH